MPRIRSIKPETPSDKKLATVSRAARLTFLYTWTIADDDGLFRAEPRQLLGSLYPHDSDVSPEQLEGWLAEIVSIGSLRWRTTQDGCRIGEIVNFPKHQNIKNRSKPFLLLHLVPLTDNLTQPSVEPPEPEVSASGHSGGAESRVRSLESRVRSQESLATTTDLTETATFLQVREKLPATCHRALEGLCRAARAPDALLGEIDALLAGLHGPTATPEAMGQALRDLVLIGQPVRGVMLREFVRKAMVAPNGNGHPADTKTANQFQSMIEEAERKEGKRAVS